MNKCIRVFKHLLFNGALALVAHSTQAGTGEQSFATRSVHKTPPNFIFVLVDDLRFDGLGFINGVVQTPHIDELAAGGMYLPNAVVTTSLCSPSRATLLTGQSTRNHRIVDNNDAAEDHLTFFPEYLQAAGYDTAFIGKWHMGRANDEPRPGFDHWVSFRGQGFYNPTDRIPADLQKKGVRHQLNVNGEAVDQQGYMTDELNQYALDWLNQRSSDKPFLLYLSHKAVHSDATPATRHRGQYDQIDIPMPNPNAVTAGAGKPMWVHNQRNSWHGVDFAYHSDASIVDYAKQYFATLSAVDDGVGQLLQWLNNAHQTENTVFIFYSDNGFMFGDHGLIDKRNAYEASVRVPMVVYAPGYVQAGSRVQSRVRNLDIAPTLLDWAGVEIPTHLEGRSVVPLLTGEVSEAQWQTPAFVYEYYWEWTFPQTPTTFAITHNNIKYIQYHGLWDLEELYDLNHDPEEKVNLLNDKNYRNTLIDLREALYANLQNTQGSTVVPFTQRRAQGLRFRRKDGSATADFPPQFLRETSDKDLFSGFFPPPRIAEEKAETDGDN